jgi:diacylglycerol kinase family enzyme
MCFRFMSKKKPQDFVVLHNPTAGRRKQSRLTDIVARLKANGVTVTIVPTSGPGHATLLARDAAQNRRCDCIVAAGGDGTISETATGILQAAEEGAAYKNLPSLGILPMGTANVMAQDLGLVTMAGVARRKITKMLLLGQRRPLRLGLVENETEKRAFVMMVGAGFDGTVVANIDLGMKKRFGKLAYVQAGITALYRGILGDITVDAPDRQTLGPSQWIIVSNGEHYAGGYLLSRRTPLLRPKLLAIALKGQGRAQLIRGNLALGLGQFDTPDISQAIVGNRFIIKSSGDSGLAEVDGDYFGRLPVTVSLAEYPIPFLEPH